MTLITGLPGAVAAAVPALVRGQQEQQGERGGGVGVVVAAGQPKGLFGALVSLQEEQEEDEGDEEDEEGENCFVMCSLGGGVGSGDAEEAAGWLRAGAEEVSMRGITCPATPHAPG